MNFIDTTATKRIFTLDKRIRAVAGGTAASKTISILIWLIDYCQTKKSRPRLGTVVSESYPHLSGGAMLDFENIMKDRGYWNDKRWVRSPKPTYTFETGNKLEFTSMDKYSKAHGQRRDVLFINEAVYIPYNIADQLITRTREVVWLDWNPTNEFWFYTDMLNRRKDIDFITLTYKDNEGLDKSTISEIESHKDNKRWWTVYGLGQLGDIEGRIYTGWRILNDLPHEATLERYGLDFGFTNHPAALVAVYKLNQGLVLDEMLYSKGMSNKHLAEILLNEEQALVIADSAEPKSITEIKSYNLPIIKAKKGKDSVLHGIQVMQNKKISVTSRSINLIKEYRNYMWEQDDDGVFLNQPVDIMDHGMDAARYAVQHMFPIKEKFKPEKKTTAQEIIEYIKDQERRRATYSL